MSTQSRVARLRTASAAVLLIGLVAAFMVGATIKAQVTGTAGAVTPNTINYVASPKGGGPGSFNWLLAILVAGPTVIAASTLFAAAEMVGQLRRGGRSRSSLGVGDEV
jgi:hypothetical protein